jgi:hypothetical protein
MLIPTYGLTTTPLSLSCSITSASKTAKKLTAGPLREP